MRRDPPRQTVPQFGAPFTYLLSRPSIFMWQPIVNAREIQGSLCWPAIQSSYLLTITCQLLLIAQQHALGESIKVLSFVRNGRFIINDKPMILLLNGQVNNRDSTTVIHQAPFALGDRMSTRLNSSHVASSYAVF